MRRVASPRDEHRGVEGLEQLAQVLVLALRVHGENKVQSARQASASLGLARPAERC
jgi:hypothetical protein